MRFARVIFPLAFVLFFSAAGNAQQTKPLREPDVIFVPTPSRLSTPC